MEAPKLQPNRYYWDPPDKEWLEYHYVHLDKTGREISVEVGATRPTVIAWLKKEGIPIRSPHQREGQSERYFRERARDLLEITTPQLCKKCGRGPKERQIEVHHIDGDPFNNELDNLQWLCRGCHTILHRRGGD